MSVVLLTGASVYAQESAQVSTSADVLLNVQGILEDSDAVLSSDGTLYDSYSFEGQAGQTITIVLESSEFDPYLILTNAQGQTIAENDDADQNSLNSALTITLSRSGSYRVLVNTYRVGEHGRYTLTIRPASPDEVQPQSSDRTQQRERADRLLVQGYAHLSSSQFQEALRSFQQALPIYQAIGDREGEAGALNNIGLVYDHLGDYANALDYYQRSLIIRRDMGNRESEGITLSNMGAIYYFSGEYSAAIDHYQQALNISREIGDRAQEAKILNNMSSVYDALGDYSTALEYLQRALSIIQAITLQDRASDQDETLWGVDHRLTEGAILNSTGLIYTEQGDHAKALDYFQRSLAINQDLDNHLGQGRILNNIGLVYYTLNDYSKSLDYLQQVLSMSRRIGDRAGEGIALRNIGAAYSSLGDNSNAIRNLQASLRIYQEIGDRDGEGKVLRNIGTLLANQQQPELAIVFLKQSVNVWESIRSELRSLPLEQQESFTQLISDTYRLLANLLLQQDRVLEAQQVLDLLKIQELQEYLRDVRGNAQTAQGLNFWPPEQRIIELYTTSLQQVESFDQFVHYADVETQVAQLRRTARGQSLNPDQLASLQNNLQQLEQPAVILYPLILDDRLELVLVPPKGEPIRRTVNVSREQLNAALATLLPNLENRTRNAKPDAQQLYQWLIQPIEADLANAGATTILYAADGQLRYLPLGALYDGHQWLIQRFRINNITAASLMDFRDSQDDALRVLAAAFSDRTLNYKFQIGAEDFAFSGLPHAGIEVENIAAEVPNTTQLLNRAFSRTAIESQMSHYSILHLATHAEFVPGSPEESFILFGNGDRVTLREVGSWNMSNADLVVLSACQTAVSGLGNGEEILGFGYQIQRTGARAAIASLWYVNDASTQTLMTAFYAALEQGWNEAEALRQAQIALIIGDFSALGLSPDEISSESTSHPYYWAPFILIGNGL
jgi:CHAT domain-containing protein/Tfp pilus assembly protein PilF